MANGRCRMHRGNTPSGIASPNYKHGRYSKALPTRLLPHYTEARLNPDLLNLTDDLAAIESRIADVLTKVETGDAGETWAKLAQTWDTFLIAQRSKNAPKSAEALATVGRLIETGAGDWAAWREVVDLIERRRKLVESEGKRRLQMQAMVSVEDTLAVLRFVGESVKRHVRDRDALAAIQRDLVTIISGRGDGRDPGSGSE